VTQLLKGISIFISPELLRMLCEMGHGDEILLADAHFPGSRYGDRVVRADGVPLPSLLEAIMPLLELDRSCNPLCMMLPDGSDALDPGVEADYLRAIRSHSPDLSAPERLERNAFYQRVRGCFAIVITGELRPYGNIILRKGVTSS
jgi:L-fucose mutarotase